MAVQRLYCAAAAHCILLLDIEWDDLGGFRSAVRTVQETSVLLPGPQILNSPACLIRSNLAFSILHFYTYTPSSEIINSFQNHLVICSSGHKHQDWKLLCVLSFIVSNLPGLEGIYSDSLDLFRRAYRGDTEHTAVTLRTAFNVLLGRESSDRPEFDHILISMLQYVGQMITGDRTHMERKFTLLEICEPVLQGPRVPEAARQIARKIRSDLAQVWERECDVWAARAGLYTIPTRLFDMLNHYFQKVRTTDQADLVCDESVTLLRTFGPPTRKLFSRGPWYWEESRAIREKRKEFRNMFNEFVIEVNALSRRNQNHARPVRDPDERWCHWQKQSASIRDLYSLPPDPPYSEWEGDGYF